MSSLQGETQKRSVTEPGVEQKDTQIALNSAFDVTAKCCHRQRNGAGVAPETLKGE